MKILSIETSCDETGISILEAEKTGKTTSFSVLANVLDSQVKIHAKYGGVFPALAKREHQKNLPILLEKALKKAHLGARLPSIDLITVTSGPGLEPALWTGIVFAKELAKKWNTPIMPANHMEGHIFSVFAENKKTFKIPKIKFPTLSLLVSGGHTELVLIKDFRKYQIIGETLDDAAGEAFDKVARMLELPYPGGPQISALAEIQRKKTDKTPINTDNHQGLSVSNQGQSVGKLPRPMLHSKNFDFSFSGLKTAVLYLIRDLKKENPNVLQDVKIKQAIALEFENAVIETLVHKTRKAIERYGAKTLIVAGGVSANKFLQKEIQRMTKPLGGKAAKFKAYFPDKKLSGDNALMIGIAGYFKFMESGQKTANPDKIKAEGGLRL